MTRRLRLFAVPVVLLACAWSAATAAPASASCNWLEQLMGCRPTPPAAPPPSSPGPGVKPDGSLDVGTANGGLTPLAAHDPRAERPAPLYDRDASGRLTWGFNAGVRDMTVEQAATLAHGAGVDVARYPVHWPGVEYQAGRYGWSELDRRYREHVARGIRPLLVVINTPRPYVEGRHATVGNCGGSLLRVGWDCKAPPAEEHLPRLKDFARRLAVRYPLAAGIEVWNEPNNSRYWKPTPNPTRYAEVAAAMSAGVNTPARPDGSGGRPAMRVLAGATINRETSSDAGWADRAFLEDALDAGLGQHIDGISLHVYAVSLTYDTWQRSFGRIMGVLDARPEPWVRNMRLALTETGLTTGARTSTSVPHTEQEQAAGLVELLDRLERSGPTDAERGRVDLGIVHTLYDHQVQGVDEGMGALGRRQSDERWPAKLAYCALRDAMSDLRGAVPAEVSLSPEAAAVCGVS